MFEALIKNSILFAILLKNYTENNENYFTNWDFLLACQITLQFVYFFFASSRFKKMHNLFNIQWTHHFSHSMLFSLDSESRQRGMLHFAASLRSSASSRPQPITAPLPGEWEGRLPFVTMLSCVSWGRCQIVSDKLRFSWSMFC